MMLIYGKTDWRYTFGNHDDYNEACSVLETALNAAGGLYGDAETQLSCSIEHGAADQSITIKTDGDDAGTDAAKIFTALLLKSDSIEGFKSERVHLNKDGVGVEDVRIQADTRRQKQKRRKA